MVSRQDKQVEENTGFQRFDWRGAIFIIGAGCADHVACWAVLHNGKSQDPVHLFETEPLGIQKILGDIEECPDRFILNPFYLGPANCDTCGVVKMTLDDYCRLRLGKHIGILAIYGDQDRCNYLFEGAAHMLAENEIDLIWTPSLIATPFQRGDPGVVISKEKFGWIYRKSKGKYMPRAFQDHAKHGNQELCVECACETLEELNRQSDGEDLTRLRGKETDIYIVRNPEVRSALRKLFLDAGVFDK